MTIAAQAAMMRFMHPGYMAKNSGQDARARENPEMPEEN